MVVRIRPVAIVAVVAALFSGAFVRTAEAVSTDDLVNLSANGVSDDVLIALIDADQSVFRLSGIDVLTLKKRGLSDRLLIAMMQTARPIATAGTPSATLSQEPVVASPEAQQPPIVHVVQTVVNTAAPTVVNDTREVLPVYVPVYVAPPAPAPPPAAPVYWGYGGQRRSDAWREPVPAPARSDVKPASDGRSEPKLGPAGPRGVESKAESGAKPSTPETRTPSRK